MAQNELSVDLESKTGSFCSLEPAGLRPIAEDRSPELGQLNNLCPPIINQEGDKTRKRFLEFFTVTIRNSNTRIPSVHVIRDFLNWCEGRHLSTEKIFRLSIWL